MSDRNGVIPGLEDLPWEAPHTFLGLEGAHASFDRARAVILPVPYESTTSYSGGTRRGPGAIVDASRYVELFDQEFRNGEGRVHGQEHAHRRIRRLVRAAAEEGTTEKLIMLHDLDRSM